MSTEPDSFEDYVRARLDESFTAALDRWSCPDCRTLLIESDGGTIFCPICGYHPRPTPEEPTP